MRRANIVFALGPWRCGSGRLEPVVASPSDTAHTSPKIALDVEYALLRPPLGGWLVTT